MFADQPGFVARQMLLALIPSKVVLGRVDKIIDA